MRIDRLHRKNQFFVQLYLSCPPPFVQKAAVEAAFCAEVAEELQKSRSKIKEKTLFFGKYKNILKKVVTYCLIYSILLLVLKKTGQGNKNFEN